MTQNKTINEQTEDEEYLDEKFPKGKSKLRGEAMVLLALARRKGKQEAQKMFLEEINNMDFLCILREAKCLNPKATNEYIKEKIKSKIGGEDE